LWKKLIGRPGQIIAHDYLAGIQMQRNEDYLHTILAAVRSLVWSVVLWFEKLNWFLGGRSDGQIQVGELLRLVRERGNCGLPKRSG
jgi:hypothetical protein